MISLRYAVAVSFFAFGTGVLAGAWLASWTRSPLQWWRDRRSTTTITVPQGHALMFSKGMTIRAGSEYLVVTKINSPTRMTVRRKR